MKNRLFLRFLSTLLVAVLVIVIWPFGLVQGATTVNGIISSDTVWTQANSPYDLTGNILVEEGATLTIQPGVTVTFNGHMIRVNGTLSAIGTDDNKITFTIAPLPMTTASSAIEFKSSGSSWNEQTHTGSIIENAVINSQWATILIDRISPKIDHNIINSPNCIAINSLSALTANPTVYGAPTISDNMIMGEVYVGGGIVSNNIIDGGVQAAGYSAANCLIFNNTISNGGLSLGGNVTASNNTVSNGVVGISTSIPADSSNTITLIQGNLICNNSNYGIKMQLGTQSSQTFDKIVIQNNTITNNNIGIYYYSLFSVLGKYQILNNNIYNNTNYNLFDSYRLDVNATYNWWGTTNQTEIANSIYDYYKDFNLGKVSYVPFLTEPNLQAPIIPESPTIVLLTLLLAATILASVCLQKKKHTRQNSMQ